MGTFISWICLIVCGVTFFRSAYKMNHSKTMDERMDAKCWMAWGGIGFSISVICYIFAILK